MVEEVVRVTVVVEQFGLDDSGVERLRSSDTLCRTLRADLVSRRVAIAADVGTRARRWLEVLTKPEKVRG
ncbi:MAG: hypothetical protein JXB32_24860 [Deltaproteobacteria bacterium]|nr:hypothetical protein [Deltaproteobacteria bacterium]